MEVDILCYPKQGPRPKKAQTGEKKDRDKKKASSLRTDSAIHAHEHVA